MKKMITGVLVFFGTPWIGYYLMCSSPQWYWPILLMGFFVMLAGFAIFGAGVDDL